MSLVSLSRGLLVYIHSRHPVEQEKKVDIVTKWSWSLFLYIRFSGYLKNTNWTKILNLHETKFVVVPQNFTLPLLYLMDNNASSIGEW